MSLNDYREPIMDSTADRRLAFSLTPVSRETENRLTVLVAELERWQVAKNLVSATTLDHVWSRHIADSLQLLRHAPEHALHWLDLGAGGGFPGLPLAAALSERPGSSMTLVESNGRKCAFLRQAARLMGIKVAIHTSRIEQALAGDLAANIGPVDVVSARALAPLDQLLRWTEKLLTNGAIGLFPKGQDVDQELTEASKCWKFNLTIHPSLTDPAGRILRISELSRR
jgi:16S rRNA (guanine527-N7)-methyltransferase